jgi:hypothetical protein
LLAVALPYLVNEGLAFLPRAGAALRFRRFNFQGEKTPQERLAREGVGNYLYQIRIGGPS